MRNLLLSAALIATTTPALATDLGCEATVRAQMVMVDWPVPMRQEITTSVAGNEFVGTALSTGANRAMYMDENGTPQSLSLDENFYSTSDGGETWNLVQTYTLEELAKRAADLATQAEQATDIECQFNIEMDGKAVHQLQARTILQSSGQEYAVMYWVDVETGFPWRVETEFTGAAITRTTQINAPDETIRLPQP
ncbi:MAG: hypothetical protein AAFP80_14845 [Pseudomonadota bacterium]